MGTHFIPQRYLRRFEDPDKPGFIWLHDKRRNQAVLAEIEEVAQARNFYSPETERRLASEVEAPANAVFDKLIANESINRSEREQLGYYIAVMLKRIPTRRRRARELLPGVLAEVSNDLRQQITALRSDPTADSTLIDKKLAEIDVIEAKFRATPPENVEQLIRTPWPSKKMHRIICSMNWRILSSTGPQFFITSDNPAFFFRAYGIATEKAEISFPLSPTHVLHGSWQEMGGELAFLVVSQAIVREINRRIASETESIAFSHEPAPWLFKTFAKKRPFLSVIRWDK